MKTIAILGANGRLSNMVAKAFHSAGYQVRAITRSGTARNLPEDIEVRAADARNEQALIDVTKGADIIFNGLNPIYTDWQKYALLMARNVMAAAKTHEALHLFPGNVYDFGREIPPLCSETTAFSPTTRKAAIRIEMEELFANTARQHGIKTIILRAGDFFGGPVTGSWFDLMLTAKLQKNVFSYPGPRDLPHAWAYLPDLADAFVKLTGHTDTLGRFESFTFTGHTLTGNDLHQQFETLLGKKLKITGVPWPVIRAGGLVYGMFREIAEMSYLWSTPHALDNSKLAKVIGPVPHTPLPDAVHQSLKDLNKLDLAKAA